MTDHADDKLFEQLCQLFDERAAKLHKTPGPFTHQLALVAADFIRRKGLSPCREHGDSFHVEYTVDDEGNEKKNLTQAKSIDTDAIAEREQTEYGWIVEEGTAHEKPGRVRVTAGDFGETHLGFDVEQTISAKTAEQLSDAFAKAAVLARQEEQKAKTARAEARASEPAQPETGSLFDEGAATGNK